MGFFQKAKDLYRAQREAKQVRKQLRTIHVQAEALGVKVVVTAEFEVVRIEIAADVPHDQIAPRLMDALNRALKKAQVVASEKMRGVMGELGLSPGA